jgi:hypothetical protein
MQAPSPPPRTLDVEEDMAFQRRNWRAERIGWAAMTAILVAAALGLFASGPLSSATTQDPAGSVVVEYERFMRKTSPVTVKVKVAASAATAEGITLDIDEVFADAFRITEIRPQPAQSIAMADGMRFRFATAPNAPATIYFHLSPEKIGISRAGLGLGGRERLALTIVTYP